MPPDPCVAHRPHEGTVGSRDRIIPFIIVTIIPVGDAKGMRGGECAPYILFLCGKHQGVLNECTGIHIQLPDDTIPFIVQASELSRIRSRQKRPPAHGNIMPEPIWGASDASSRNACRSAAVPRCSATQPASAATSGVPGSAPNARVGSGTIFAMVQELLRIRSKKYFNDKTTAAGHLRAPVHERALPSWSSANVRPCRLLRPLHAADRVKKSCLSAARTTTGRRSWSRQKSRESPPGRFRNGITSTSMRRSSGWGSTSIISA